MFISSEGDVLCHVLVIVILSADVFFGFGSQFHGFFHLFANTYVVDDKASLFCAEFTVYSRNGLNESMFR